MIDRRQIMHAPQFFDQLQKKVIRAGWEKW